jgi:hypothetical protein
MKPSAKKSTAGISRLENADIVPLGFRTDLDDRSSGRSLIAAGTWIIVDGFDVDDQRNAMG